VNLRPKQEVKDARGEAKPSEESVEFTKGDYVKTSITLARDTSVRARKYVNEQKLAHAQGKRKTNYSFSQLLDDALNFYLDDLEKGESNEKDT
jgi:hypothetical protein